MGQQVAVDTTSGGNAINITIIESGIGIASGNGSAGGDIQLLEVVSVLQVAAAIQFGAALVLPLSVMVKPITIWQLDKSTSIITIGSCAGITIAAGNGTTSDGNGIDSSTMIYAPEMNSYSFAARRWLRLRWVRSLVKVAADLQPIMLICMWSMTVYFWCVALAAFSLQSGSALQRTSCWIVHCIVLLRGGVLFLVAFCWAGDWRLSMFVACIVMLRGVGCVYIVCFFFVAMVADLPPSAAWLSQPWLRRVTNRPADKKHTKSVRMHATRTRSSCLGPSVT